MGTLNQLRTAIGRWLLKPELAQLEVGIREGLRENRRLRGRLSESGGRIRALEVRGARLGSTEALAAAWYLKYGPASAGGVNVFDRWGVPR